MTLEEVAQGKPVAVKKAESLGPRRKIRKRITRIPRRMGSIWHDATQKATTMLVRTYRHIGIEDLNVQRVTCKQYRARSILDGTCLECRPQLS
ncbi:hypothetical protein [Candidatus Methylacidithermus pantelleriae]|uniref:Transposase n=1 Tax=Candidatus Methylacidithermus pantelleriae TaxID=2744239 RepID=A0A8J2BP98_9BACT|nr:hypothetical protein [Candidatus Methylacidithermus pantelleriae]CAF0696017.1 hypothetical protein MPNT_20088 [Candidatus Methylacidithermus pantelleriae]